MFSHPKDLNPLLMKILSGILFVTLLNRTSPHHLHHSFLVSCKFHLIKSILLYVEKCLCVRAKCAQIDAIGSKEKCEKRKCINARSILRVKVRVTINTRKAKRMFPPGLEPGTLRVLGARDNRYTTEQLLRIGNILYWSEIIL